jgi:hypothetical protein
MIIKRPEMIWAWWYTPVIPVHRRLRQEDGEFQAIMNYIMKSYLKKTKTKQRT